jgi:alpha/beta superfamily hydrolase
MISRPMTAGSAEVFLAGPAGRLEASIRRCPGAIAAAVICHSHPLYGGSMLDKVVSRTERALYACDLSVLRFNFRGVGKSVGAFDAGYGERDDLRAAIEYLAADHDEILVGGFSFGAWVALEVGAQNPRVSRLLGIGLPANLFGFEYLRKISKPLLAVQGERDAYCNLAQLRKLIDAAGNTARLHVVEGADHFFSGHLESVMTIVAAFATAPASLHTVGA